MLMALLVCAALAVPFVLGVRDWRCYGVALLWPPVISAIQTGNVTLWLALALRRRLAVPRPPRPLLGEHRNHARGEVLPLAARRLARRDAKDRASAVLACVVGVGVLLVSWAVIGFAGFVDYPSSPAPARRARRRRLVHGLHRRTRSRSPVASSRAVLWLALGLCARWSVSSLLARSGDERTAFIVAIAASLALTPIVWLHYFALLLVVVALAQPRLGLVWFVPLAMVVTPGSGHPTPFETAWTLGVVAIDHAVVRGLVRECARASSSASSSRPRREPRDDVGRLGRRERLGTRRRGLVALARERAWALAVWAGMVGVERRSCSSSRAGATRTSARAASTSGTWCRRSGARRTGIRSR